jgi:hypothetical protein
VEVVLRELKNSNIAEIEESLKQMQHDSQNPEAMEGGEREEEEKLGEENKLKIAMFMKDKPIGSFANQAFQYIQQRHDLNLIEAAHFFQHILAVKHNNELVSRYSCFFLISLGFHQESCQV